MRRFCIPVLAGLAVLGAAGGALSQDLRPGIVGRDDRVPFQADGAPWDAIGQVNIAAYRVAYRCSGTLIAPNLVVTAAHCVVDPWRKTPYPLHAIHFLAGVRRSQHKAHGTAKCLHFPPSYAFTTPRVRLGVGSTIAREDLLTDVAMIVLNETLAIAPAPLADPAAVDGPLLHASYPADRRSMLSVHKGCRRTGADFGEALWLTDCDTHHASSGGPVFSGSDGPLTVAAIMVAVSGGRETLALPLSQWRELAAKTSCP